MTSPGSSGQKRSQISGSQLTPAQVALSFRAEIRRELEALSEPLTLVGFLSTEEESSHTYSEYTRAGCEDVGVRYEVRMVDKHQLEKEIIFANEDSRVHGIIVYYPIFGGARDSYLRNVVSHQKDVEGLNSFWLKRLYSNERFLDDKKKKKAVLPCTPLAVFKLLEASGVMNQASELPFAGKTVTVFNRSEVVGRPLAFMMANDGAEVFSFDIDGVMLFTKGGVEQDIEISRAEALKRSEIVITGVPNTKFKPISAEEINAGTCCLNFSSVKNFEADVQEKAGIFIPRVGPVTVAMCLRNTLRLYTHYHQGRTQP